MLPHLETGKSGEDIAALWFEARGYQILERNWRSMRNEVDIIATKQNVLHFIEIKTRTNDDFAPPEIKVKGPKLKHLKEAAQVYLERNPQWKDIQFDIFSIILKPEKEPYCYIIEDVF